MQYIYCSVVCYVCPTTSQTHYPTKVLFGHSKLLHVHIYIWIWSEYKLIEHTTTMWQCHLSHLPKNITHWWRDSWNCIRVCKLLLLLLLQTIREGERQILVLDYNKNEREGKVKCTLMANVFCYNADHYNRKYLHGNYAY